MQVSRSVEYVQSGTVALQDAKQMQKKTRKWMCCAIILLLVVAAVIVIVVRCCCSRVPVHACDDVSLTSVCVPATGTGGEALADGQVIDTRAASQKGRRAACSWQGAAACNPKANAAVLLFSHTQRSLPALREASSANLSAAASAANCSANTPLNSAQTRPGR